MEEKETLAMQVGRKLLSEGKTMATAESCTGGNIAHLLTLTPGSSAWFNGGVVSYTNQVKMKVLGVPPVFIKQYTEVSAQVAEAMAEGARRITGADYAISTTGIAGPTGGTADNPVGTVFVGLATPDKILSEKIVFGTDRASNIEKFSDEALSFLLRNI